VISGLSVIKLSLSFLFFPATIGVVEEVVIDLLLCLEFEKDFSYML
jgi:hypothetical protein